jgi:hypothetical protein
VIAVSDLRSGGGTLARTAGLALGVACTLGLALAGACSCDTPPPPAAEECGSASAVTITALELGDPSTPFTASAHAEQIRGGQGLSMLSFRIAVQSDGEPTCIDQRTQAGPTLFARPLAIASHEGDWWVTAPLYVITSSVSIPVTTTVGGLSVTRTMSVTSSADAGRDAR